MARKEPSQEGFEGVLTMSPRGFGFVMSVGRDDVYVPADAIGGALHGDRVFARVVGQTPRGYEGRVVRVVSRRNPRVAGVLRKRGKSVWVEPDDAPYFAGDMLTTEFPQLESGTWVRDGSTILLSSAGRPQLGVLDEAGIALNETVRGPGGGLIEPADYDLSFVFRR